MEIIDSAIAIKIKNEGKDVVLTNEEKINLKKVREVLRIFVMPESWSECKETDNKNIILDVPPTSLKENEPQVENVPKQNLVKTNRVIMGTIGLA